MAQMRRALAAEMCETRWARLKVEKDDILCSHWVGRLILWGDENAN